MTQDIETPAERRPLAQMQVAEFELTAGPVRIRASARLTPVGFLAIGAMVTGIVLATTCLVWSATSVARMKRADRRGRSD